MTEIFGTFIISEKDGQYSGEYFNNKMDHPSNEEIKLIEKSGTDIFVGKFDAYWQESKGNVSAVLEIDKTTDIFYTLSWSDVRISGEDQAVSFQGVGFIRNGELVAAYTMNQLPKSN